MKTLIGAIALTLAIPATAQTLPAATDPHAGHQTMDHSQHKAMDHSQHKAMDHSRHAAKHECKECCEKMKQQDGKMACMDKKDGAKAAAPAAQHSGHAH
ncbi:hypothetical protein [Sphingomonas edaphi]|uniref:Pentapeptide MXKDX repeat protein n=1 Tax=Sphingomonas edaphi TaxID=2315689 RepID=A0A418Q097_9SPHN|nr:hypothetical protein [Sphingomonas edaphi]RIX29273.1 hypothetical protein D3M59_08210 [Sphingomonas edaphi]